MIDFGEHYCRKVRKKYNIFVIKMDPEVLQNEEISNLYKEDDELISLRKYFSGIP